MEVEIHGSRGNSPRYPNLKKKFIHQLEQPNKKNSITENPKAQNENSKSTEIVCRFCKRFGHKQSTCRYQKRKEATKQRKQAQQKQQSEKNFKYYISEQINRLIDQFKDITTSKQPEFEVQRHRPEYGVIIEQSIKNHCENLQIKMQKLIDEGLCNMTMKLTDLFSTLKQDTKQTKESKTSSTHEEHLSQNIVPISNHKEDHALLKSKDSKNQARPESLSSDEDDNVDFDYRNDDNEDDWNQIDYEQECQYKQNWFINKKLNNFGRKDVKVFEKDVDENKFVLTKFWKTEKKKEQPCPKRCKKCYYRVLNKPERERIQKRDKRKMLYLVEKL